MIDQLTLIKIFNSNSHQCDTPYHNFGLKLSQFDSDIDSRAKEVYDIRGQYDRLVKF